MSPYLGHITLVLRASAERRQAPPLLDPGIQAVVPCVQLSSSWLAIYLVLRQTIGVLITAKP